LLPKEGKLWGKKTKLTLTQCCRNQNATVLLQKYSVWDIC